jgi:hypothetical protein
LSDSRIIGHSVSSHLFRISRQKASPTQIDYFQLHPGLAID